MDGARFDRFTRAFVNPASRRRLLRTAAKVGMASLAGVFGRAASGGTTAASSCSDDDQCYRYMVDTYGDFFQGMPTCRNGQCILRCERGWHLCADPVIAEGACRKCCDDAHCPAGVVCRQHECQCPDGTTWCRGRCLPSDRWQELCVPFPGCESDAACGPSRICTRDGFCESCPEETVPCDGACVAPPCKPCTRDGDCGQGEVCGPNHTCRPGGPCTEDNDCGAGAFCCENECGVVPCPAACNVHSDCGFGRFCCDHACSDNPCSAGCQNDNDCPSGRYCARDGRCLPQPLVVCPDSTACEVCVHGDERNLARCGSPCPNTPFPAACEVAITDERFHRLSEELDARGYVQAGDPKGTRFDFRSGAPHASVLVVPYTNPAESKAEAFLVFAMGHDEEISGQEVAYATTWQDGLAASVLFVGRDGGVEEVRRGAQPRRATPKRQKTRPRRRVGAEATPRDIQCRMCRDMCVVRFRGGPGAASMICGMLSWGDGIPSGVPGPAEACQWLIDRVVPSEESLVGPCWSECFKNRECDTDGCPNGYSFNEKKECKCQGENMKECGGLCTDTSSDDGNCGGCAAQVGSGQGKICNLNGDGRHCSKGRCCPKNYEWCAEEGGEEEGCRDLTQNEDHCGECNKKCAEGATCNKCEVGESCKARCECPTGQRDCRPKGATALDRNVCVDTKVNQEHCGGCGIECGSAQKCLNGKCRCAGKASPCGKLCCDRQTCCWDEDKKGNRSRFRCCAGRGGKGEWIVECRRKRTGEGVCAYSCVPVKGHHCDSNTK